MVDHHDWASGISLCHPEDWSVDGQFGTIAIDDPASDATMAVHVVPLPVAAAEQDPGQLELGVLDRLAAARGITAPPSSEQASSIGGLPGSQRMFEVDEDRVLLWSSVGEDSLLRTVVVHAPVETADALIQRIRFTQA